MYSGVTYMQRRSGMALRPLHDRLLVKRLEEKEQMQGGIIIPDTAKEKPQQAQVLAVGPGRVTEDGKLQPIEVKVGDTVVFGKYAGTEVKVDGDDLLIIREDDVLGVLES
jgi:chaperonin GroES